MSGNKANRSGGNNFETYRQIAPETVDDQRLHDIIKNNGNNNEAILLAIENLWHDTPDQKAVGSEWVTTAKNNKKDVPATKGSANSSSRRESGGGRGSAGRGRSLPSSGGRGGGDSRGERGAQRSGAARASPSAASPSPTIQAVEEDVEEVVEQAPEVPAVVAAPVAAVASSGATWGAGPSLAERLKRVEAEKLRAEQQAKETPTVVAAPGSSAETAAAAADSQKRTRARRARGGSASGKDTTGKRSDDAAAAAGELADAAESLTLESSRPPEVAVVEVEVAVAEVPPPPPLVQVASAAAPSVVETTLAVAATSDLGVASSSQGFLNMGKWEAPVEAERSAFQFGSFGVNAYGEDDGVNGGVSASQVGTNPSAAPWTGLHSTEEKVVSNVWGTAGADQSLDMSSGLFAQQSSTTSKALETAPDAGNVAATRAPPGLGQNKPNANASNNASRSTVGQIKNNKTEIASAQNQAQQTQLPAYQQQQQSYNQGVPPGMNNRNAPVLNPLAGGLPYAYNPSFDLAQQAQFSGYPIGGGLVPPTAPAAAAASAAAPVSTSSAAATSAAAPATGVAQQQQQPYPAAPFPFYPNPYYPSQAYYYGQPQMPNYYGHGQGRDMYQQRGNPYGGNPYGNAGSLYPGDVYGQQAAGQFPDAAGNYGGVHPGAANTGSSAGNNSNKTAKNSANPAGAVGAGAGTPGMTPEQHSANLLMNSGYGYVNPYNARGPMDGQGWQGYPGNQAAAWGAPMMFPNNSSPTNLSGSAQQQGQAQQQSQQQQGGNRGANSGYANNSFGGRGNGAGCAPSAGTGVSTQGSW